MRGSILLMPAKNKRRTLGIVVTLLCLSVGSALSQTWTPTGAPSNSWHCVATSADGTKLAIGAYQTLGTVSGGPIYLSTDSGLSWTQAGVGTNKWSSLASSADGTKLFAVADDGNHASCRVIFSTNSGLDWGTNLMGGGGAVSPLPIIRCSADGSKLVSTYYGVVWTSTNSGTTWISNSPPIEIWETPNWFSAACSADGNRLVVVKPAENLVYGSPFAPNLFISTNGGTSWLQFANLPAYGYLASSADGNTLAMAMNLGANPHIFLSTNAGVSWETNNQPLYAGGIAVSADGAKILASGYNGWIRSSTNSGVSWMTNDTVGASPSAPNLGWAGAAMSADGTKWFLTSQSNSNTNSGRVYSWQTTPSTTVTVAKQNGLLLSWLIPSTNFVLQQSFDFTSWSDVTNEPVLNFTSLQYQVTLQAPLDKAFYRLKTP